MYLSLDPQRIAETSRILQRRIAERFPDSSLTKVAGELHEMTHSAVRRSAEIRRPRLFLRAVSALVVAVIVVLPALMWIQIAPREEALTWSDFIQDFEAGLASVVFLGAAVVFLVSLERRAKRNRALRALHEIRSLAHVVDMHQLTKDPEVVLADAPPTASSPGRSMTRFELLRYLDYCSEMLSIMSKVAALYVQDLQDPIVLENVDSVEALTTGLSRKIWQKIMILSGSTGAEPDRSASSPAARHGGIATEQAPVA